MRKYEELTFLIGSTEILERMAENARPMAPFAEETLRFLRCWSDKIRKLPQNKKDSQSAAFGFWIREAGIHQMKERYVDVTEGGYIGDGLCLQFVPSNVPSLFAYSLAAGLLAGCSVAMRVSSRESAVNTALVGTLNAAIEEMPDWKKRIALFRYEHDRDTTDALSLACNVRVIWGGDASVAEIRRSKLRPTAGDITFPNRKSMAIISAEAVLKAEQSETGLEGIIRDFYNDTYLNDQNACSSPGFICWLGDKESSLKTSDLFFGRLSRFLEGRYEVQPKTAVRKLEQAMYMAADGTITRIRSGRAGYGNEKTAPSESDSVIRVLTDSPGPQLWEQMTPGGFFVEYMPGNEPDDGLSSMLTDICQTISLSGVDKETVTEFAKKTASGKRFQIVPMGHTMDFDLNWDGHDLLREMCHKVPDEMIVERNGCSLNVHVQGEGRVLILIHGVACDSGFYRETARILEKDFTVITYDRRGYSSSTYAPGVTEEPGWASVSEQAEDVKAILDNVLKPGEKAIVAGCSAGGIITLEFARRYPELTAQIFLYEAAYAVNKETLACIEDWKEQLREAAGRNLLAKAMLLFINAIGPKDTHAAETPPDVFERNFKNLERFLHIEMEDMLGFSARNFGMEPSVPVVLGAGTHDSETMFYRMMKDASAKWGRDIDYLDGCHNLASDRPDIFASWIREKSI